MAGPSEQPDRYTVDRLPDVTVQIRRLVERAKQLGMGSQVLDALEAIVEKLETMPLEWGEPKYATRQAGGLVLHGTEGVLEVLEVDNNSGYPTHFEVQTRNPQTYSAALSDQPYLQGEHLTLEEPHVYVDIMDLADAILENRAPRATGEQARHVVEIIEKARLAAQTGQTQTLVSTLPV